MISVLFADVALSLAAFPCAVSGLYLGFLSAYSSGALQPAAPSGTAGNALRFEIIIPAHNEELVIAAAIRSVLALEYPVAQMRVIVVADNCTDRTASIARSAGVRVLDRVDASERGKGYALALAFADCLRADFADAIVVVDADSEVSSNLLSAFAMRINAGAHAVQASYGVKSEVSSWRTRLMSLALTLFHDVRSLGRERLGVSCGLRGNGMGFSRAALMRVPYQAFSLVEDLEYGIQLALAGVRVAYVPEASVVADVPTSASHARTQRLRWEGGRAQMARRYRWPVMKAAWANRDPTLLDIAADLLVPPLATLAFLTAAGLGLTILAWSMEWVGTPLPLALWAIAAAGIAGYLGRGCALSDRGARILLDLAWAPLYIAWKLPLRLLAPAFHAAEWVRTEREARK